ncbi:MAG: hypothetical protein PWP23_2272 [Candidatus Sumerlaeota bacterium]|nr:hypothetical protein [Candidatus Sumerlaeota bacterium]
MSASAPWKKLNVPPELAAILEAAPSVRVASTSDELIDLACGGPGSDSMQVTYALPDGREVVEAEVMRVRNGVAANYPEPYMRRRDPDCMMIADDKPTDKTRFEERFGSDFTQLRNESFEWLKKQDLAVFGFVSGQKGMGPDSLVVCPANAGFFAFGLALLQGIIPIDEMPETFSPKVVIYVAPTFRHTHFDGRQIVVHNRRDNMHELFSYNLYPGPSAKKGIYGVLIAVGEREGWVTAHCSTVRVVTPYDNEIVFMHEGASGGGKSEMLEYPHRLPDGRLQVGCNTITGESRYLEIPRTCDLQPVTDDMALCHASLQDGEGKLVLTDAENAWFVRVNHITQYGTDLNLESLTAVPPRPLLFLNLVAVPGGRAMIWEHIEDEPGKPCPNPRVILPRSIVPNIVNEPVRVDIRSIGVRTPPCTREKPTYGIMGLLHLLPPSLAWLWRLVAPRGHANPSIVSSEGMSSEGVGSYWPFSTGRKVDQANLLLDQIVNTPRVRYILCPNQHVGAWEVGFMPQWLAREYLARRGNARFKLGQVEPSRCPLLGYSMFSMQVEGRQVPRWFLQVNTQPEVGNDGYDAGAKILDDYFRKQLSEFLHPELNPLGRRIIECCLSGGKVEEYEAFTAE